VVTGAKTSVKHTQDKKTVARWAEEVTVSFSFPYIPPSLPVPGGGQKLNIFSRHQIKGAPSLLKPIPDTGINLLKRINFPKHTQREKAIEKSTLKKDLLNESTFGMPTQNKQAL